MKSFTKSIRSDRGASMVEYGLIVAVIALMALSALTLLGEKTETTFTTAAEALDAGVGSAGDGVSVPGEDGAPAESDETGSANPGGADTGSADQTNGQDAGDQGADDQSDDDHGPGAGGDQGEPGSQEQLGGGENVDADGGAGAPAGSGGGKEELAASYPGINTTGSEFYWWNNTPKGGDGAWKANASFKNDTNRHQYLDLLVTRVDDKGVTSTVVVNGFYVPANGSATYTLWDNPYSLVNGVATGVVKVKVEVVSVTTSNQNWQPYSYQADPNQTTVGAPSK